jgi:hypothetical protein
MSPSSSAPGNLQKRAETLMKAFDEDGRKLLGYTPPSKTPSAHAVLQQMKSNVEDFINAVLSEMGDPVHPQDDVMMAE